MNMFAKRISLVLLLCAALASAAFALHPMKVFLLRGNRGRLAPEVEGHFYLAVSGSNDFHHVKHAHKHWLPWLPTIQAHHLKSPHRGWFQCGSVCREGIQLTLTLSGFHGEVHAGLHLRPGAVGAIVEAFKARIKHGLTQAVEKRHPCHEALLQLGCVDKYVVLRSTPQLHLAHQKGFWPQQTRRHCSCRRSPVPIDKMRREGSKSKSISPRSTVQGGGQGHALFIV